MKTFGECCFKKMAYFPFDQNEPLQAIFEHDLNPRRILDALGLLAGWKITPETLVVFDEIQECPRAVTSLKYFCERLPEQPIVSAGSYLGMATHPGHSFPVGKVNFLTLRPLNFSEFLDATGESFRREVLERGAIDALAVVHKDLLMAVKKYLYVGGMPAAVDDFVRHGDLNRVRRIQNAILKAYQDDFSKLIPPAELAKMRLLWQSIPGQLAKENKKFMYSAVKKGARAKAFELAISRLEGCGFLHCVHRVTKPGLPLMAYRDPGAFKIFFVDVGLLSAMSDLPMRTLLDETAVFSEFKGALAEQYVLQEFVASDAAPEVFYWTNGTSTADIDFLIQSADGPVPIEVKAGINRRAKSLNLFVKKFGVKTALRISSANHKRGPVIRDIPLYACATAVDRQLDCGS